MAFSEQFLEEIAARNDILDVVGSYVSLTKRTGGNQFGLCPFHSEKTPSFSASSDKQMYYCFGCHKGGGVINFIMEVEGLPFPDAVKFLADRAGIIVPQDEQGDLNSKRRETLLQINKEAARYFHQALSTPLGAAAVDYINKRGITKAMVKNFGLGVAPEGWSNLTEHLIGKGFSQAELVEAGLVRRSNKSGGVYDGFRNRLMFPVIDIRGNVLGFSGRSLGNEEPKYINTSDTFVFNKSRNLYGIHLAKKSRADYFLLTEGNIDVIALHQAGFDSAIAALGTSFTQEQARLMHRYKQEVIIAFDADNAGQKATDRAISILEKTGIRVRVLRIPAGKDPDDFIKEHGRDAFLNLLEQRETHIEFRLLSLQKNYDLTLDPQRVAFLQEAEKLLAALDSEVEMEVYGQRVAEMTGIPMESLRAGIKKRRAETRRQQKKKRETDGMRAAQTLQPKIRSMRYENAYSAAAEQGVIRLMLHDPSLFQVEIPLQAEDFSSAFLGRVYDILLSRIREHKENTMASLGSLFSLDEMGQLTHLFTKPENLASGNENLENYIKKIETERLKKDPAGNLEAIFDQYKKTKGGQ